MLRKKAIFSSFWLFSILALFFMVIPTQIEAKEVIFGVDVNFSETTVDTNYYFTGGNLKIDADFSRDLVIAAGKTYLEGKVAGDTTVAGGEVNLNNYVSGDLRVLGGTVNLSSTVLGDLIIIGGRVNLLTEANILGDTILIGGTLKQNTKLSKDTSIIAASVMLNDEISGDTDITTQNIIFGPNSKILSSLNYYAPVKALEKEGSIVTGIVKYNQISTIRETGFVKSTIINILNFWIILKFITTLILAFILVLLFKVFSQGVSDIANQSFFKSVAIGFLSFILMPIFFVVLMVSLIGLPLGILMVLIYILLISLASAFAGIIIGTMVTHMLDKNPEKKVTFPNAVIGIVLLTTVQFVPTIGDFTILFFALAAIGAMIRFIYKSITKTT